jgi:hypothetical protein
MDTKATPKYIRPRFKPYAVLIDNYRLWNTWATEHQYQLPSREFFDTLSRDLHDQLKTCFPKKTVEFLSDEELALGLQRLIARFGVETVSLENIYVKSTFPIELTRYFDENWDVKGVLARPGAISLAEQLDRIAASGVKEVCVIDDVVFGGETVAIVISQLHQRNVRTVAVLAGVAMTSGVRWVQKALQVPVYAVETYSDVIDLLCERDFFLCAPYSGRVSSENGKSLPHWIPFCDPYDLASIPRAHAVETSRFCFHNTLRLMSEVEKINAKPLLCKDLPRQLITMEDESERAIDFLNHLIY